MTIRALLLRLFRRPREPLTPPLVREIASDAEPRYWRVYRVPLLDALRGQTTGEAELVDGFEHLAEACEFCLQANQAARYDGSDQRYCVVPPGQECSYVPRRSER